MEEKECGDVVHKTPLAAPALPQSRVPAYIDPTNVASKDDLNNAVQEIKNNPDVVDIVATKADLDAYDKSQLTDKDIVKVLTDESQGGGVGYYRYSAETTEFTLIGTLYKATQETLSSDKGTAVIANDPTGGLLKFTTNDGKQSGIAVNDGEQDIYAQLYSKTTEDNNGARISLNPTGAYYTKGDKVTTTPEDEIVTLKSMKEYFAEQIKPIQTKIDELTEKVNGLIEPKTLDKTNINNTPGTFIFTGNSDNEGTFPKEGCDWAGIQLAAGKDAYQIIGSNGLWIRVNDGGVTAETTKESWGQWIQINTTPELH